MMAPSPAVQLLIWSARSALGDTDAGDPPLTDMGDADWGAFLRAAFRHAMVPVASRELAAFTGVPELVSADLGASSSASARRSLTLAGELLMILRRLESAGVRAVPWKGPLLAERAYGDVGRRYFFDLDVLVQKGDLWTARDLFLADGFRTEKPMTPAQQKKYVDRQGELELVRDSDGLWLELHTAIVPNYYSAGQSADDLWRRLRPTQLARRQVLALAPADELEALCVHGSKHKWERLLWVLDVALMSRLVAADEWQTLARGARDRGTLRMLHLGLRLAMDLCSVRLPDQVMADVRADRAAAALAAEARRDMFDPRPRPPDSLLFHLRMRERGRDRLRYVANVLFTPSGADWERLALPQALFPLYAITRPLRLGIKYSRRFIGREGLDGTPPEGVKGKVRDIQD